MLWKSLIKYVSIFRLMILVSMFSLLGVSFGLGVLKFGFGEMCHSRIC